MSYPQNPETVIIKNEFYPEGLREIDIWKYYQKVKVPLLRETLGKTLIVFFAVDLNKFTVLRKNKSGQLIRLNHRDFNEVVSGRTVCFNNTMGKYSDYGIIDIDIDNFDLAKETAIDIYDTMWKDRKYIDDVKIRFTGKNSFHIICYLKNEFHIEDIKRILYNFLIEQKINKKYTITGRRTRGIPNLDLNRNVFNSGHISLYSLSIDGLRCMYVEPKRLRNFKKDMAKI